MGPACFRCITLLPSFNDGLKLRLKLDPSALCISFIITSVIEDEFKDSERRRILQRTSTPDCHLTDLLIADQEPSITVNTPNKNLWFCMMLFFPLHLHLITWPSDDWVCLIYSIVWGRQTRCPFYRHHGNYICIAFVAKVFGNRRWLQSQQKWSWWIILLMSRTEHLPFWNVTRQTWISAITSLLCVPLLTLVEVSLNLGLFDLGYDGQQK